MVRVSGQCVLLSVPREAESAVIGERRHGFGPVGQGGSDGTSKACHPIQRWKHGLPAVSGDEMDLKFRLSPGDGRSVQSL